MKLTLTSSAIEYTLRHIMRAAAPALAYTLEPPAKAGDGAVLHTARLSVHFRQIPQSQWPALAAGNLPSVCISSFDGAVQVPVFPAEDGPVFRQEKGVLYVNADFLTLPFLLLSRGEELLSPQRDPYGRFLYEFSLSKKYGFVDIPLVDEYALLLRQWLLRVFSVDELGVNTPAILPTHDMDAARRFPSAFAAVKTIVGGDLLHRRSIPLALESAQQYWQSRREPSLDPALLGAEKLLNVSVGHGLSSEFYFMGLEAGEDDFRYEVQTDAIRAFSRKAEDAGMVCGFHGSRLTPGDAGRFALERQRVADMLGYAPVCGRQHYLCFDVLRTPAVWAAAGMKKDATLGFSDREGFRCGTCFPFPLYDLEHDCALPVTEHPLAVMEVTLRGRGLCEKEALASMRHLFARCTAVGGEFVLLWHNDNTMRDWRGWFEQVYVPFMDWASKELGKE